MKFPRIHSPSGLHFRRMYDAGSVMKLAIRSVPLNCGPPNLEKIECSMAEAMAATLRIGGYRKYMESWQTAGKHWVAICPAHCRAICRVCSRAVDVKARMKVDARVKLLESVVSLTHGRRNKVQLLGDGLCFISSNSASPPPMARACPEPHVGSFPWSVPCSGRLFRRR